MPPEWGCHPGAHTLKRRFEEQQFLDVSGAIVKEEAATQSAPARDAPKAIGSATAVEPVEDSAAVEVKPKKKAKKSTEPKGGSSSRDSSRQRSEPREGGNGGLSGLQHLMEQ